MCCDKPHEQTLTTNRKPQAHNYVCAKALPIGKSVLANAWGDGKRKPTHGKRLHIHGKRLQGVAMDLPKFALLLKLHAAFNPKLAKRGNYMATMLTIVNRVMADLWR